MESRPSHEITRLLIAWGNGERTALDKLIPLVYEELRRQAHFQIRRQPQGNLLQTADLVNEVYVRMIDWKSVPQESRKDFYKIAARAMRNILIDIYRKRPRASQGEARLVPLDEALNTRQEPGLDLAALDDALNALDNLDPRKCAIVELRFFVGLSAEEVAEVLEISPATVAREWAKAKAWLYQELNKPYDI
ncbi:MAG: ECF-type sigma factor [Acidobacteria bacterium]|nr:ECF-type sigma factor [Acidobacteriota bacterium]